MIHSLTWSNHLYKKVRIIYILLLFEARNVFLSKSIPCKEKLVEDSRGENPPHLEVVEADCFFTTEMRH